MTLLGALSALVAGSLLYRAADGKGAVGQVMAIKSNEWPSYEFIVYDRCMMVVSSAHEMR